MHRGGGLAPRCGHDVAVGVHLQADLRAPRISITTRGSFPLREQQRPAVVLRVVEPLPGPACGGEQLVQPGGDVVRLRRGANGAGSAGTSRIRIARRTPACWCHDVTFSAMI